MTFPICSYGSRRIASVLFTAMLCAAGAMLQSDLYAANNDMVTLAGHRPRIAAASRIVARAEPQENIRLALTLPLHNQAGLTDFLQHANTPGDPAYGQYLTPETFAERFGPSQAEYDAVAAYARANGLSVQASHANRLVLDVSGPAATVERTFATRLFQYQAPSGKVFRASETNPMVPVAMAKRLSGIVGLDTAAERHPHNRRRPDNVDLTHRVEDAAPRGGSGSGGGLSPQNIKTAYNLTGTPATGAGQTVGVFELDGYRPADITAYEQAFGLPAVPLQNVLVDGVRGTAGTGADEVTLDIELVIAMAPGISKVMVYEGPDTDSGIVDTYSRIATDNLAKQISTTWGLDEGSSTAAVLNSENTIFQQMAAQGQTVYAAGGDNGAYDNGAAISVDDPASQPYVTAVGGTKLNTGTGAVYQSETTWNAGSITNGAGGGGISSFWPLPSYQAGLASTASLVSASFRNVPDVSLDSDPATGYSIYYRGAWSVYGGTSCAAPLWAGFTALVNQQRIANGGSTLGFANPVIYGIGKSARYSADFHDIADGSTNLYYSALAGYDDATGWGTMNGANLLADLSSSSPGSGTGGSQFLQNPGFENGANGSPWVATAGVIDNGTVEPAHSGAWKARLNGYGHQHDDVLYQTVTIPDTVNSATLSFWLHIDTAETTARNPDDTLMVQVRSAGGTLIWTLAAYSNVNAAAGYTQKSFDLSAYKGRTIQIYLHGRENSTRQTTFVVDDFALNVQ